MSREEIKSIFYNILKEQLCLDDNYFSRFSNDGENKLLIKDLGADALDWHEILSEVEYRFNIIIKDTDFGKCESLYDFINLINFIKNN